MQCCVNKTIISPHGLIKKWLIKEIPDVQNKLEHANINLKHLQNFLEKCILEDN